MQSSYDIPQSFEQFRFKRDDSQLTVNYRTGFGLPLLLLHGLAGTMAEWGELILDLEPYFPVLTLDLRGHGQSERIPSSLSPHEFVEDCKFVLDKLGIEKAIVVGQSMGGIVATLLAANAPESVAALVLVDAGMSEANPDEDFSALQAWLDLQDVDTTTLLACIKSLTKNNRWGEWQKLELPTLVCLAEASILSSDEVDKMKAIRSGCQYHVVKGAGHDIHLDQPKALAKRVNHFVSELHSDS